MPIGTYRVLTSLSFLPHPAWGFLAGPTDNLILKAYARHHQTI